MAGQVPVSAHLVDLVHGITGPSQVPSTASVRNA
jgi:hypothetical protein